ncbi:MAG TPA: type II secretion system protein [Patescibacteria group bacterium]|nr:type II secretion system protein [Patescibacteria group bacterium]
MTVQPNRLQKGFTLIELLVVIGILAVLLGIVLVAINPARQFALANNTKRQSDVNTILNAIHQYAAENNGDLSVLGTISEDPTAPTLISDDATAGIGDAFCSTLVTEFVAALPADPNTNNGLQVDEAGCDDAAGWATGYTMIQSADDNRITVMAPGAELAGVTISVTR